MMAIIYRQRAGIRYSELSCAGCHRDFAASEDALNFYYDQAPALPYLCPTCRRERDQNAVLYDAQHCRQPAAI